MERELRKGNLIKGIGLNIYWTVEGVHNGKIYASDNWRLLSSFEPIPLTEEWLVKFGFVGDSTDEGERVGFSLFRNTFPKVITFTKYNFVTLNYHTKLEHIKHVHQLQNLIYSLTGEELTINE